MACAQVSSEKDAGPAQHLETTGETGLKSTDAALDAATRGQVVTGYEVLGVWETVKTFKLCTFVCFAAAFSAATDGYQIGSVRSIVSEKKKLIILIFNISLQDKCQHHR